MLSHQGKCLPLLLMGLVLGIDLLHALTISSTSCASHSSKLPKRVQLALLIFHLGRGFWSTVLKKQLYLDTIGKWSLPRQFWWTYQCVFLLRLREVRVRVRGQFRPWQIRTLANSDLIRTSAVDNGPWLIRTLANSDLDHWSIRTPQNRGPN